MAAIQPRQAILTTGPYHPKVQSDWMGCDLEEPRQVKYMRMQLFHRGQGRASEHCDSGERQLVQECPRIRIGAKGNQYIHAAWPCWVNVGCWSKGI